MKALLRGRDSVLSTAHHTFERNNSYKAFASERMRLFLQRTKRDKARPLTHNCSCSVESKQTKAHEGLGGEMQSLTLKRLRRAFCQETRTQEPEPAAATSASNTGSAVSLSPTGSLRFSASFRAGRLRYWHSQQGLPPPSLTRAAHSRRKKKCPPEKRAFC